MVMIVIKCFVISKNIHKISDFCHFVRKASEQDLPGERRGREAAEGKGLERLEECEHGVVLTEVRRVDLADEPAEVQHEREGLQKNSYEFVFPFLRRVFSLFFVLEGESRKKRKEKKIPT